MRTGQSGLLEKSTERTQFRSFGPSAAALTPPHQRIRSGPCSCACWRATCGIFAHFDADQRQAFVKSFDVEPTAYGHALLTRSMAVFDEIKQSGRDIEFLADPTVGEIGSVASSR
jgi:hypothetical protein